MTTWQIGSRRHAVTTEVMWDRGHVVYRVDRVGAFTILRDKYAGDEGSLFIAYGVYERYNFRHDDREARPEAPVINGITLVAGAGGIVEDRFDGPDWRPSWSWPCRREGGGSAPVRTTERAAEICRLITLDYLARPDRIRIEQVRARHLAPERLKTLTQEIEQLREEIATRQQKLTGLLADADVQLALTAPRELAG